MYAVAAVSLLVVIAGYLEGRTMYCTTLTYNILVALWKPGPYLDDFFSKFKIPKFDHWQS